MRGCESGLHVVAEGNVELMYGVVVGVGCWWGGCVRVVVQRGVC